MIIAAPPDGIDALHLDLGPAGGNAVTFPKPASTQTRINGRSARDLTTVVLDSAVEADLP